MNRNQSDGLHRRQPPPTAPARPSQHDDYPRRVLRIRVLGSLDATLDGQEHAGPVDLGGRRQRSVLALLLVARGDVVSVDRLIDDLWRGEPPPRAMGALQAYVSHLRRGLEPERAPRTPAAVLISQPPGYALRLPVDAVDAWQFEEQLRRASQAASPESSRALLEPALRLWRGEAYAEFTDEPWVAAESARLAGLRLVARERLCAAMLGSGAAAEAAGAAEALTRIAPLREEGWRLLALALAAEGRQADAVTALRSARRLLADELGLDPGPGLRSAEADVLAGRVPSRREPLAAPAGPETDTAGPGLRGSGRAAPSAVVPGAPAGPSGGPAGAREAPESPDAAESAETPKGVGDGRLPTSVPLVGRLAELNALHEAAAQARADGGRATLRAVLVSGEPGAGKSALLERFGHELAEIGWRACVGRCPEADGAPPAWAWVEVLRAIAQDVDPGPLTARLAPLLDDTADQVGTGDAQFGRFVLQRTVTEYLREAAAARPLAVFLDDVHRGDVETVALLAALARPADRSVAHATTPTGPLLLVAAYRPTEVTAELQDALAALVPTEPVRLHLAGLEREQAARLVQLVSGVQPDHQVLDALVARTDGNPFYLRESARLLRSEGSLVATSKVPDGVRDVLRRRLARLPERTVSVLRLASVMGRDVDVDVLVEAAEVDEEAVLDALETGVLAGLLDEPTVGTVRFTHALVRDTLYGDLPRLRRGRWHSRVAEALGRLRPNDPAALAHHYSEAGTSATARAAVDSAVRAAEQAMSRFAHDAAADYFALALAGLDRLPEPGGRSTGDPPGSSVDERAVLMARRSLALLAAGAGRAALTTRNQALELADRAGRMDLIIQVLTSWDLPTPWITREYGSVDQALVSTIERALAEPELTADQRCRLRCALVTEAGADLTGRAESAADEAEAIARGTGDPRLLGLTLSARCMIGAPTTTVALRDAAELIEIGKDPGMAMFALIGHYRLVQAAACMADLDRFRHHFDEFGRLARQFQSREAQSVHLAGQAFLAQVQGDPESAARLYGETAELLTRSGAHNAEATLLTGRATTLLMEQRIGELQPLLDALYDRVGKPAADMYALALAANGHEERARTVRGDVDPVLPDYFQSLRLTARALAVVRLDARDEAPAVYEELSTFAGEISGAASATFTVGPVDTALGDLAVLLERPDDAADHYRSALALARTCGNRHWCSMAEARLAALGDRTPA